MANAGNIRPYSDLVHEAAQNGGPDRFLQDIADSNFALGVEAEKDTEGGKIALAALVTVVVVEGVRWIASKIKGTRQKKKEALQAESDAAMAAYKECKAAQDVGGGALTENSDRVYENTELNITEGEETNE